MKSLNKVCILGCLGSVPELKRSEKGLEIVSISVVTECWKGKDNIKSEWHRIVFFGQLANTICKFADKGSRVYLEGALRTNKWTTPEGVIKYSTNIVANSIVIIDFKKDKDKDESIDNDDILSVDSKKDLNDINDTNDSFFDNKLQF